MRVVITPSLVWLRTLALGFILLGALFFFSACGGDSGAPDPDPNSVDPRDYSSDTAVTQNWPEDRSKKVSPIAPIAVQFTKPVRQDSVDAFTFQVLVDDMPLPGRIVTAAENTAYKFVPTQGGLDTALPPNTKIQVKVQFVRAEDGTLVAPYIYDFRTKEAPTGSFKMTKVWPGYFISNGEFIEIEFSEEIKTTTPVYTRPTDFCTGPGLPSHPIANAVVVQEIHTSVANRSISTRTITPQVCVQKDKNTSLRKRLRIRGPFASSNLQDLVSVRIVLLNSPDLTGVSGAQLKSTQMLKPIVIAPGL